MRFFYFLLLGGMVFFSQELNSLKPIKDPIRLTPVFREPFKSPLDMQPFPRRFPNLPPLFAVVEKRGVIYLAAMEQPAGKAERVLLLDAIEQTLSAGWEEGMLSLAFDPAFATTGRMYVYASRANPRRTVLSRYTLELKTKAEKIISLQNIKYHLQEEVLLEIRQPFANHNGGTVLFGPDGKLYLGTGDGGSAGDPRGYAQNPASLLGKILRLDVTPNIGYTIPPDNPFVNETGYRPEIFALGLRNPWRMSFSPEGLLIAGDVGQNLYEEISIIRRGENHGWNIMEGFHCFLPKTNCDQRGLTLPVLEYGHEEGVSVLGGFTYTKDKISFLKNKYIFADSLHGTIWYADLKEKKPVKHHLITLPGLLSSFARDHEGEIYIIEMNEGRIFRVADNSF